MSGKLISAILFYDAQPSDARTQRVVDKLLIWTVGELRSKIVLKFNSYLVSTETGAITA